MSPATDTLEIADTNGGTWQLRRRPGHLDWNGMSFDDRIELVNPSGKRVAQTELDSGRYLVDWLSERMEPSAFARLVQGRPRWLPLAARTA
jgi:hypothetical protein